MTTHKFKTKLREGQETGQLLDHHFRARYEIWHASPAGQRQGIDRWFTERETGERFSVNYKSDRRAVETQRAFIEVVSVDRDGTAGWAESSKADWIYYYLPQRRLVYRIEMEEIRRMLEWWGKYYRSAAAPNDGYNTYGLLVPFDEFVEHVSAIEEIPE